MKTVRVVVMTNVMRKYESCSNVGNSMNSGDGSAMKDHVWKQEEL